jgi:hypothetical protein
MSCIFFVPIKRRQLRGLEQERKSLDLQNKYSTGKGLCNVYYILYVNRDVSYGGGGVLCEHVISKMEKDYFATISTGIEKVCWNLKCCSRAYPRP